MSMPICARCKKNMAVVFITKLENGKTVNEGLCLKCAKELGIKPVADLLDKFGLKDSDLDGLTPETLGESLPVVMEQMGMNPMDLPEEEEGDEETTSRAPAFPLFNLFRQNGKSEEKAEEKTAEGGKKPKNKKKFLNNYAMDLTAKAREGKLDRVVGRDSETLRVIQILNRRQKNNPCLIGEPGVGKTAIAEALAMRIVEGNVPYKLRGKEIYLLDMTALVAGTQFRGQFESRILGLLNEVREVGNAILVIDEVHNIVGTGEAEGSVNAANILKPALSRGEVQIIGATTLNEYRKYIEKDTALERRFQPVTVNEPSLAETVEMLLGIKHYYEEFHGILVPDALLRRIVTLSERYITDRYLPDKAIDLLDEAASSLSLSSAPINETYEIRDKLLDLKQKREDLEGEIAGNASAEQGRYEEIAKIMPWDKVEEFRARGLNPEHPHQAGTAQNPDIYFQFREANNRFYDELPQVVEDYMARINEITGEDYHLFNYYGAPDAERVIVAMGSVSGAARETVAYLASIEP